MTVANGDGGVDAPFAHELDEDLEGQTPKTNGVGYPAATRKQLERDATEDARWRKLVATPPAAWYAERPPPRTWLLRDTRVPKARGVLPLGKVGQLIAEGGAGKTLALCQLAIAVATGGRWLGVFSAPTPGRVLLVLGEEDVEEVRRRLHHAAAASDGPPPSEGTIEVMPLAGEICALLERDDRTGDARETAFLRWLRDYIRAGSFRLVVVDPLSRFAGADAEKDNAQATRFVQALESLLAPDRTVLNAHHVNKMSRGATGHVDGASGRGSSAFVDGARWQAALAVEHPKVDAAEERRRLGEVVRFAVTKSNYAPKPDALLLRRDESRDGALVPLDATDLALVETLDGAKEAKAARETAAERERCAKEDAALDAVLAAPSAPTSKRAIRAGLAAALGTCSHDRADAAIARRARRCP
jgi:RecA-family ATPase